MEPTSVDPSLLLPEGTRLLHIGPPKTATTAVQGAFHAARLELRAQGVHYAGRRRQPGREVAALTGRAHLPTGTTIPPISGWKALVREVNQAREPRVVISSEYFAGATPDMIARTIDELGAGRVHVAVTLRPLARILPSRWQQNLQTGQVLAFGDWLDQIFNPKPGSPPHGFWFRHRHDELVRRWADVVGPDHVTVVVLDDTDRDRVMRVFEAMLGLRSGTLDTPAGPSNRSLTLTEAEAVRAFNIECRARRVPTELALAVMFQGAVPFLKELDPEPDWRRIELPGWAAEKTADVARLIVDGIAASGVRVVGDLDRLSWMPERGAADAGTPVAVPPRLAALVTMGALIGAGVVPESARGVGAPARRPGSAPPATPGVPAAHQVPAQPRSGAGSRTLGRVGSERSRLGRNRSRLLASALAREVRESTVHRLRTGLRLARQAIR